MKIMLILLVMLCFSCTTHTRHTVISRGISPESQGKLGHFSVDLKGLGTATSLIAILGAVLELA